jgi:hypothetical protein
MNYYIQGDAAKADQIKAAFEKLGYYVTGFDMRNDNILFFTYKLQTGGQTISTTNANLYTANIIKTHPDYKELELPKPHYDIINFKPFDKVLVRDGNSLKWTADLFSYIDDGFVCTGGIACRQCIPYNDDTKHLLGTTDMPSEEYINW